MTLNHEKENLESLPLLCRTPGPVASAALWGCTRYRLESDQATGIKIVLDLSLGYWAPKS